MLRRFAGVLIGTAVSAMVLSACSPAASTGGAGSPGAALTQGVNTFEGTPVFKPAADLLPPRISSEGTLKIAFSASNTPPVKYKDPANGQVLGLNPDLARLLGRVLGVKVEAQEIQFAGIIPALQSKRFDVAIASMSVTPERLEVVDMVDYARWGSSLMTESTSTLTVDSLCGHKIAVTEGSAQMVRTIPGLQQKCTEKGSAGIDVVLLPGAAEALTQIAASRIDGYMADTPGLAHVAQSTAGKYRMTGSLDEVPIDIATTRGSDITKAVDEAMKHIATLPEYKELFKTWNLDGLRVETPELHSKEGQ